MKTKDLKLLLMAGAVFSVLSCNVYGSESYPLIKEQPHNIYHVVQQKTLLEVANQLANRSGITFQINPALEGDWINQKLAADDWNEAVAQLLRGYNYTLVSDKDVIKTVVITGRNGSGRNNVLPVVAENELLVVTPDSSGNIPARYKKFNGGSVFNVHLPMAELARIPVGDDLILDLPIGQYKVKHDNFVDHNDGSSTWIGYLDEEGRGYRVYLSQGDTGVMGNIYTPDGAYNIETADGQTVIVDIEKSGLQSAGYEHDQADSGMESNALMEAAASAMDDQLSDLKSAAESARASANTLASEAKAWYGKYLTALETVKNVQDQVKAAQAALAMARTNYVAARNTLNKASQNSVSKANFEAANTAHRVANLELAKTVSAYNLAIRSLNVVRATYNTKLAKAKAAEAIAKRAEAAYAATLANTNQATATNSGAVSTTTASTTVVDLMVLYTTVNQTGAYARQRIKYLVDVSNQAYKDSGINMSLRLIHTRATSYVENNANSQALSDLANDRGVFAGTAALRNQYGADLVALFRPLYAKTAGSCGTAYVGFANGSDANSYLGFGTIGDGYSKDSLSNYYCGTNTFTHEIGHNLGNVHDREYSNVAGKFPYSYAWGVSGKFGTIMSYYGPSVMLFSTPKLATQCASTPCGFAEGDPKASDQTKTINYTAPYVAAYRSATVTVPVIQ